MAVRVVIGLGSNLEDRESHLAQAILALGELGDFVAASTFYETAPIGGPDQGPYLNAAVAIDTNLSARAVLERCLEIEAEHGRERRERWGPRTLDLDILLYGHEVIDEDGLKVPHPRLHERRFALEPLLAVWPQATMPDGTPVADLLRGVSDQDVRAIVPTRQRALSVAAVAFTAVAALALWWLVDWVVG
jgi:2-amino-4-hydroxy-6-hydroxymethyldihydropteridine diphosphokinase